MAGAVVKKLSDADIQNPTQVDKQIWKSENMPTLPGASQRIEAAPAKPGTGAPEKRITQEERDAQIKREQEATRKAQQDAKDKAYRDRHGSKS